MIILGLTGSIGMGKSTAAERFKEHNIPVLDADKVVHDLYQGAGAPKIEEAFPGTTMEGVVDRTLLSRHLMKHPEDFKKLEAIIHPMVRQEQVNFIADSIRKGEELVVLEIPLLLENGSEKVVDAVIVMHAEDQVRRARVMKRPGMTEEKLNAIIAKQMPDDLKCQKADYIVDTSKEVANSWSQIDKIISASKELQPSAVTEWKTAYPDQIP